jgi:hypothetical protein
MWHDGQIRSIDGTIKDGRISWFARDVKAVKGNQGPDVTGTIKDQEISLSYTGVALVNRPDISGAIRLRLKV